MKPVTDQELLENSSRPVRTIHASTDGQRVESILNWLTQGGSVGEGIPFDMIRHHMARFGLHTALLNIFRPSDINALLFIWWAEHGLSNNDPSTGGWAHYTRRGLVEETIQGSHYAIMYPPSVEILAEQLTQRLHGIQTSVEVRNDQG